MSDEKRSLAKCSGFDAMLENHGCVVLAGSFDYEDGGSQGLGYVINAAFLREFMRVFNVERLQQVNGRSCWVTHSYNNISKVEPLHKADGKTFDIKAWSDALKEK